MANLAVARQQIRSIALTVPLVSAAPVYNFPGTLRIYYGHHPFPNPSNQELIHTNVKTQGPILVIDPGQMIWTIASRSVRQMGTGSVGAALYLAFEKMEDLTYQQMEFYVLALVKAWGTLGNWTCAFPDQIAQDKPKIDLIKTGGLIQYRFLFTGIKVC